MKKSVIGVSRPLSPEAIGSLWQARAFFGPAGLGRQANPAIHAELVAPQRLAPADDASHPPSTGILAQAGFEAVTLLLEGELQVRTALPAGLPSITLAPGDVLWNGTGHGVLSEIQASPRLAREGGMLSAVTLWVNLPAACKASDPHRQHLPAGLIPSIVLPGSAGTLRLIAGQWNGELGPAETVQPLQLWDLHLKAGHKVSLPLPQKWYAQLLVLSGCIDIDLWPQKIDAPNLILLDAFGDGAAFTVREDAHIILLCCEPLDEPIVSRGALVFADAAQLQDAEDRLARGDFGTLAGDD